MLVLPTSAVYLPVHSGFDWTVVVAIATIILAAVTAWLAYSTRKLARASTDDQRAQWRPILSVDPDGAVAYHDGTGELTVEMLNVGRGPAFGISAEMRSGDHPLGATVPGRFGTALAPGERFQLHTRVSDPSQNIRGRVVRIEVSYYDVTEYWHRSHLTMTGRRPPDRSVDQTAPLELRIESIFFEQTNKRLLPITGSPRSQQAQRLAAQPWWKRIVKRLLGRT